MKIGFFSYSLSGIGPRTRARTLIDSLADRNDHDIVLVTGEDESFTHPNVEIYRISIEPTRLPPALRTTRDAFEDVDLVHVPVNLYQALFLRTMYRGPLVVGAGVQHTFPYRQFAKILGIDQIVETHEYVSYLWERTGFDSTHIYPSIDSTVFTKYTNDRIESLRINLDIPDDDDVVLFVGKLNEFKGAHIVSELAVQLPEDVTLVVAGDGPLKSTIAGRDDITYLGFVENEDLAKYYNVADVTVVPSEAESFSLVSLESISCGTPVVTTAQRGTMVRLFKDRKTYVWADERTVDSVREAVMELLTDDNQYEAQIERGLETIDEMGLTIQDTVRKYEDVYQSVAENR